MEFHLELQYVGIYVMFKKVLFSSLMEILVYMIKKYTRKMIEYVKLYNIFIKYLHLKVHSFLKLPSKYCFTFAK